MKVWEKAIAEFAMKFEQFARTGECMGIACQHCPLFDKQCFAGYGQKKKYRMEELNKETQE